MMAVGTRKTLHLSLVAHAGLVGMPLREAGGGRFSGLNLEYVRGFLEAGFERTKGGKFQEALVCFQHCLQHSALVKPSSPEEAAELEQVRSICVEYVLAMRMKLEAKKQSDPLKQLELSCYMACCGLAPPHLKLALSEAVKVCNAQKNFLHAAHFCRKLIELPAGVVDPPMVEKYKKYYAQFSKLNSNAQPIVLPPQLL